MSRYGTTPRAQRDLIEHYAYIARDKIAPADRFLKVADQTFQRIADMPRAGRVWESTNSKMSGIRVYPMPSPYRSYLVFYRIADPETVSILAVLHGARNIDALLDDIIGLPDQ
jgi:plasmid stabilization system protein ParE